MELQPIEALLAQHRISDFEIFHEEVEHLHFEAKDQGLEASQRAVQRGIGLRVFRAGRMAFSSSTDLSEDGLRTLVDTAVAALPWMDPDPDLGLPPLQEIPPVDLKNFDAELSAVPAASKIQAVLDLEKAAKSYDPRIRHVRSASYDEKILRWRLKNSSGLDVQHTRSRCHLGVMAVAESGGDAEGAYEFEQSPFFRSLDPEAVGKAAATAAASYLGATTPASRRAPVALDPLVTGEILEALIVSFQGDSIHKKRSFLEGKRGQKLYSSQVHVIDDSLLPGGMGSCPFDGEGQPGRSLTLVENGVVKNFLLDHAYGCKLGLASNASSVRRGVQRPPAISYSNLRLLPGELSDAALFREMGSGLYVTETFGMHAANPVTGDFSVGVQGFLIEGGEKRGPVKKLALAGNLHRMLADVRAIGSRWRSQGQISAPALAIEEMAISGL